MSARYQRLNELWFVCQSFFQMKTLFHDKVAICLEAQTTTVISEPLLHLGRQQKYFVLTPHLTDGIQNRWVCKSWILIKLIFLSDLLKSPMCSGNEHNGHKYGWVPLSWSVWGTSSFAYRCFYIFSTTDNTINMGNMSLCYYENGFDLMDCLGFKRSRQVRVLWVTKKYLTLHTKNQSFPIFLIMAKARDRHHPEINTEVEWYAKK